MDLNQNCCTNLINSAIELKETAKESDANVGDNESMKLLLLDKLKIKLTWSDLSYSVSEFKCLPTPTSLRNKQFCRRSERMILHPQSGQLSSGRLMALIGKSGAGKSTLIESLTGRRNKGLKGDISINIDSDVAYFIDEKRIKIAFIPQSDVLLQTLTVYESIKFASKLKNRGYSSEEHERVTEQLLNEFDLNVCKDTLLSTCSGGQKKRLSVAVELVSRPTVLVLDEPTSGLDSGSALQCVKLLRKLSQSTSNPLAIIVSIHQPSAKLLEEFHTLYLLSYDGRCIYNGPVNDLISVFNEFNVPCPQYHNPADHALEVSSGDYGEEVVDAMAEHVLKNNKSIQELANTTRYPISAVIQNMRNHSGASLFSHCSTLTARTLKTTFRDPILNYSRLVQEILIAAAFIAVYGYGVGEESGCLAHSGNNALATFSLEKLQELNSVMFQNIGLIIVHLIFTLFSSIMPIVLVYPTEMTILVRERTNGWYSCLSFYLAKTIADIPFLLVFTTIYAVMIYYPTGQVNETWRFGCFLVISILVAFFGQSLGMVIGTVFSENARAAAFIAPISIVPFTIFAGFFLKVRYVPSYLQIFCYISCMRYGFEALVVIFYGFDRCALIPDESQESVNDVVFKFLHFLSSLDLSYANARPVLKALVADGNRSFSELDSYDVHFANFTISQLNLMDVNEYESLAMQEFDLKDYYLWTHIVVLIVMVIVVKVFAYILLLRRANKRN